MPCGRRALLGLGALPGYRLQANSEDQYVYPGSQSVGDKLHGREGNNPDRQLRPQIFAKSQRILGYCDSRDVGLEAATI